MTDAAPEQPTIGTRLRTAIYGDADERLRATWRVLLATPLLWFLTGGVLTGNLQSTVEALPAGATPLGGLTQSVLHAGFFLVALIIWARYVDRRPLSSYGVSASARWLLDLLLGLGAVFVAFGGWYALGSILGWTTVALRPTMPQGPLLVGLVTVLVALGLHAWVQQTVFFRIVLKNAAEGLHSRGVNPPRSVVGGLLVAVVFFLGIHTLSTPLRVVDLVIAGGVFGLLFVHTGELSLPIGVHLGVSYVGGSVFSVSSGDTMGPVVFDVTESIPAVLPGGFTRNWFALVVAYLLLVAWLRWARGTVTIDRDIAR